MSLTNMIFSLLQCNYFPASPPQETLFLPMHLRLHIGIDYLLHGPSFRLFQPISFALITEDVSSLGIRLRLYGCERMRRERLLGECILGFASLHLELETTLWLNFEPRYHLSVSSFLLLCILSYGIVTMRVTVPLLVLGVNLIFKFFQQMRHGVCASDLLLIQFSLETVLYGMKKRRDKKE